ncbi:MAG: 4Fe-4S dicluster domain-containing protein [Clostridia bacterium]|nr:4Fe-4S dicluster domain-containing protein [Clostridia bacterium]
MKDQSVVADLRRQVFCELSRVAYEADKESIASEIEEIPYIITPTEVPQYRESIYRERQIASERVRLAMGLSLRPANKPVHLTEGLMDSAISERYYEPPLMQVIPSACDKCPENKYKVTNMCRNCVGHFCIKACPKGAISVVEGKSHIDQEKCIQCGRCKAVCPYDAISHRIRPCEAACGIDAISSDEFGRAKIDSDKCVACGQCMAACPFGAIADKSQIFQLITSIRGGSKVIAEVAPAIAGQFGPKASLGRLKTALMKLGFADMYEVADGADMGCIAEAHHYARTVATGQVPFLLTSCCPAWAVLVKKQFPDIANQVSQELTPMVATAREIKEGDPEAKIVFIGPCAAKKLEASRRTIRSYVDFVITFEELAGMFESRGVIVEKCEESPLPHPASSAGRGYAVSGGVASAVEKCINEYYPGIPVDIHHAEGLADCKRMLSLAKAGKMDGCMIEGMGCPGGCVAGVGTIIPPEKARILVGLDQRKTDREIPSSDILEKARRLTKMGDKK